MKPRITRSGEAVQKGNIPKKIHIHGQIERWDCLPGALVGNLGKYDTTLEYAKFKALSSVDDYAALREKG